MIPELGYGTWQLEGRMARAGVRDALILGCRHIDTAEMYGNEEDVAEGIRRSGVDRDEIFVASKVWHEHLAPAEVKEAVERSRQKLDLDAIDLMYIHWPASDGTPLEATLDALMEEKEAGHIGAIGVSNFTPELLDEAVEHAPIEALQVEHHPYLDQDALLERCRAHDLMMIGYSPLAQGKVLDDPVLQEIAASHEATPAQVAIAWLLAKDHCGAIPKAEHVGHRRENIAARELSLSTDEIARIDAIDTHERIVDPERAPWHDA